MKKSYRGQVIISDMALKRAILEHGTCPPATGTVQDVGGGLVSVLHDNGETWDWNPKSVNCTTIIKGEQQ